MIRELKNDACAFALWRHLRSTFAITAIVPLYFTGATAAAEFLTYVNTKLYFCIDSLFGSAGAGNVNPITVVLRDAADAINGYFDSQTAAYTGAVLNYVPLTLHYKNYFFSRIQVNGITYMKFNGYKLTIAP